MELGKKRVGRDGVGSLVGASMVFQVLQLEVRVVTPILNTKIVYYSPLDGASAAAANQLQAGSVACRKAIGGSPPIRSRARWADNPPVRNFSSHESVTNGRIKTKLH